MTKGEVDRLGEKIRQSKGVIDEQLLNDLQDYRTSYKEALSSVFNVLCRLGHSVHKTTITTYRIKRFESIIGKLSRESKMKFSRMWDIAGCRCIVRNNLDVYKIKNLLEKEGIQVKKINDYVASPKRNGYKSLHLYVSLPNDDRVIEVQIRNRNDHNWATLVEITDLLFDSKLKEYGENKDLLRFHYLLSKVSNLSLDEKYEIAQIIDSYKYFNKLIEVFSKNYLEVRKQWLEIENQNNHQYFFIETTKDSIPRIESFSDSILAEDYYFQVYKKNQNANIILTHLSNPNYNEISVAYSNYILTFHSFLDDFHNIMENLIEDSLKNHKYIKFFKLYSIYNEIVVEDIRVVFTEVIEANVSMTGNKNKNNNKKNNKNKKKNNNENKVSEWIDDIKEKIIQKQSRLNKMQKILQSTPVPFWSRIITKIIAKIIYSKYDRKLNKILPKTDL